MDQTPIPYVLDIKHTIVRVRLKFGVKWGNPGSCKGAAEIWCQMGEIQASVRVRLKFGVKWGNPG